MFQQNCYLHLQSWRAGMLNILFKFVQEICSHQLKQYWTGTLSIYLVQHEPSSFLCICAVYGCTVAFCFVLGKEFGGFKVRRALVKTGHTWCHGRIMFRYLNTKRKSV